MDAALIMQDRETDSWWSIMTSDAIGGELDGQDLVELPVSRKMTWGAWKKLHPETLILSVEGEEHDDTNHYENYFGSEKTFRDMVVADDRLSAKAPIFTFWLEGKPYAVANQVVEGGKLFRVEGVNGALLFHREPGAPLFASTEAYHLEDETQDKSTGELLTAAREGGADPLEGFDTFWYNWVAVNEDTELLE